MIQTALYAQLKALVFAVWGMTHHGPLPADAEAIADALVSATIQRSHEAPALGSPAMDLVTAAVWVENESRISTHPHEESWDSKGGISCGMLQMRCEFVRTHSLRDQASRWLQMARWGAKVCTESPLAPLSSGSCHRGRRLSSGRIQLAHNTLEYLLDIAYQQE
jgi:hypothetical protein